MSRWCKLFCAALAAVALSSAGLGCGVEVDAEGKVVPDRVWFDQMGGAHCPKCDPDIKLKVPADAPPSLVKAHSNVCAQDEHHTVRWAPDDVPCWKCTGSGKCPDCQGSGLAAATGRACGGCIDRAGEDDRAAGSGRCVQCRGKGTIRYGG